MNNASIVRNKLEKLREQARRIKEDERLSHEPDDHVLKEASDNAFLMCEPQFNSIEAVHNTYDQGFYSAVKTLKEQEDLKQKMWNALYAEEDKLEKKFIGTEEHNDWFTVYRPWLQRGFEIAIKVIAGQDGKVKRDDI